MLLRLIVSAMNFCGAESLNWMSRYYFDFQPNGELYPDYQGVELSGLVAAKDQAIKILAEISQDAPPRGGRRELAISVRDRSKRLLLKATLVVETGQQRDDAKPNVPVFSRKFPAGYHSLISPE